MASSNNASSLRHFHLPGVAGSICSGCSRWDGLEIPIRRKIPKRRAQSGRWSFGWIAQARKSTSGERQHCGFRIERFCCIRDGGPERWHLLLLPVAKMGPVSTRKMTILLLLFSSWTFWMIPTLPEIPVVAQGRQEQDMLTNSWLLLLGLL